MKAQVSIEFFAYFAITMLVLAALYSSVADRQVEAFEYRENSYASNIGSSFGYELEQAQRSGEGYQRDFDLPREIFGEPYVLTVDDRFVVVEWSNNSVIESTRYSGREFQIQSNQGPFEVKNNGSIYVVPQ